VLGTDSTTTTPTMRIEQSYFQKSKALFHAAQALFTFVAGCLALAILTKSGNHGGQIGFFFALVSLLLTCHVLTVACHPLTNSPDSASSASPP
jgi:hypothetical protein